MSACAGIRKALTSKPSCHCWQLTWGTARPFRLTTICLSARHAFFHFVAARNPEHLELAQRVLGIRFKRAQERVIDYLEYEEIDSILKAIDRTTSQGARDYALLATMFNTGARVQEIVDLRVRDLQLVKPFQVRLDQAGLDFSLMGIYAQSCKTVDLANRSRMRKKITR
jgi:integrase/recombinase XerD